MPPPPRLRARYTKDADGNPERTARDAEARRKMAADEHFLNVSLAELMQLEPVDEYTFRSMSEPFSPMGNRTYGGHVYAQAAWAASQTVGTEFILHSISGFFILPGSISRPFVYHVKKVRDGGSFQTRTVEAVQRENKGVAFTCTCSFKRSEIAPIETWRGPDLITKYASVLDGKTPDDHEVAPRVDQPWYWRESVKHGYIQAFPGLECRKVDMTNYNKSRPPIERRQVLYYAARGEMPPYAEQPNLHHAAHLYATDRNSLFLIPNNVELGDGFVQMASLSITVVFHDLVGQTAAFITDPAQQSPPKERPEKSDLPHSNWFLQENHISWIGDGRGLHESRLYNAKGGVVATTWQEGLVRFDPQGPKIEDVVKAKVKL